jgi:tRNA threonylcarbamoyladenosine biosynthesis protein TsaB
VLDARMGQVYSAAYEWRDGRWHEVQAATVHSPEQLACPVAWQGQDFVCAGNAWPVYEGKWPQWVQQPLQTLPTAQALCQIAPSLWQTQGGLDPALALPFYVRDKVAQTSVERASEKAAQAAATVVLRP